ncbi:YafY family transcriptional regulator [Mucilaginibacter sp. RS28]|uniref:YafY family transcriptional regulator n=1 Tax=Mucilaginibacter straminoryzae TaxID=2932774 RepID=A0A9X1WZJ9_9SPHI|nr:YafY family protein [Mucilaginibacter straminoryzae]MCJ8208522.1 YafY family transcriptional regulator [Mucilaginibacter straminoryzae]
MNRIDRISAILIQLQSRRTVKASDIAERFGISLRTVYRDVKTLEEAGVPIIGEAGVGYSLVEGYRLPPVMFTREEAAAFLTAEKLVDKLTDEANSASYRSAMYKIKSVLRNSDKDFLETIDNRIEVIRSRGARHKQLRLNPLQDILQAIAHKKVLQIVYQPAYRAEATERAIEPVGVFYLDNNWHLIAYCRLRKDYRDFRFDRLMSMECTDEIFSASHPQLQEHIRCIFKDQQLFNVTIEVKKEVAMYLGEQKYYHGYVGESIIGDVIEMKFVCWSLEGFSRWFVMFADMARIVEPAELNERIHTLVRKISENLTTSKSC